MEMLVISLLFPALRAEWGLSSAQEGLLASSVFAGILVGNILGGRLGDCAGRRFALLAAGLLFLVAGAASAMAPDFTSLCIFRAITGVAVGTKVMTIASSLSKIRQERASTHTRALARAAAGAGGHDDTGGAEPDAAQARPIPTLPFLPRAGAPPARCR
jgi:MFS family permease